VKYEEKILSMCQLILEIEKERSQGKTIIHCHGCFDIVHPGHIHHLSWSKTQADVLLVSITADKYVEKGNKRPYFLERFRAGQIAALEFVDYVYINPYRDACRVIEIIKPDFFVKGFEFKEHLTKNLRREKEILETVGGKLLFSPGDIVYSSSEIGNIYRNTI